MPLASLLPEHCSLSQMKKKTFFLTLSYKIDLAFVYEYYKNAKAYYAIRSKLAGGQSTDNQERCAPVFAYIHTFRSVSFHFFFFVYYD